MKTANVLVVAAIGAVTVAGAVAAGPAQQPRSPSAGPPVNAFVGALRSAVARRDRRAVAGLFQYPAIAMAGGLRIPLDGPAAVIRMYDLFFTPEMRCAIETRPATRAADGLSIGAGSIWARQAGERFGITRVVVPPSSTQGSRARPTPVRLGFSSTLSVVQLAGALIRDESESFLLFAEKGQFLQARIDGFRGHDAELRLVSLPGGAPVDAKGRTRAWDGVIPATSEYRLDVIRRAPYCDPVVVYMLNVSLR